MKLYSVEEALQLFIRYKITSHKETIRRWLRGGALQGIPPTSRKEGWMIQEDHLCSFIKIRVPDQETMASFNTSNDVLKINEEEIRATMWWQLVRKNTFEDFIEVKKTRIRECMGHDRHSKAFKSYVWDEVLKNKGGYAAPRLPYLLDAFLFGGERIPMDQNYDNVEDKILFALVEHLRKKRVCK